MPSAEAAGTQRAWNWAKGRLPFLWITVSPVLTLPLAALLIFTLGGEHGGEALGLPENDLCKFDGFIAQTCNYYFDVWRIGLLLAIPGILNLGVLLWFLKRNRYIQVAAIVALMLALIRTLIVPLATIAMSQFDVVSDGGLFFQVEVMASGVVTEVNPPSEGVAIRRLLVVAWTGGLVFWAVTVVIWRAYEPVMARFWRHLDPPSGPRQDAPPRWTGFLRR
ncbi:MAG: hypothetical protein OXE43_05465 [Chloroflexi bacterium]|nr:hypothetical protein [Chloroflexota bacterium]